MAQPPTQYNHQFILVHPTIYESLTASKSAPNWNTCKHSFAAELQKHPAVLLGHHYIVIYRTAAHGLQMND